MTEDFYDLLDVSRDASQDEIKRAYREKVQIYHPDRNDDERARAQFTAVKKAYDILGDPVERQAYDRLGHEDYVAKRTKGLPSADVWRSGTDGSSDSESADEDDRRSETSSSSATSTGGGRTSSRGATGTASASTSSARGAAGSTATSSGTGGSAGTAGARSDGGATASATGAAGQRTGGARRRSNRFGDNALVQWWRRQNVAGPLLWIATLTYLVGLAQFGTSNVTGLEALRAELSSPGSEPGARLSVLIEGRYGIQTVDGFLAGAAPIGPPAGIETVQWYGLLGGLVAVALLGVVAARLRWRGDPAGRVTIDETIVVALALVVSTTLAAGPLLAGLVLLPLLFGVVVRRTRGLPGWSPSYVYVVAVTVPVVGLLASVAGYSSLATDLLAFLVVPVAGAIGLPLRVAVRKRFGI